MNNKEINIKKLLINKIKYGNKNFYIEVGSNIKNFIILGWHYCEKLLGTLFTM